MEQSPYPPPAPEPAFLRGLAYGLLAVLGVMLGLVGSFEFSWQVESVPVAAVGLTLVNLAVFLGAGWAMESKVGALVPAVFWIIVVLVLASRRPEGDLVVTGTAAGYSFIFGGALAALAAVVATRSARPWITAGGGPHRDRHR